MSIGKGFYVLTGKHPKGKEKDRVLLSTPPKHENYCLVYNDDICMIDIDDYNHTTGEVEKTINGKLRSDILKEYLDANNIKYNGIQTENGKHFVFKKPRDFIIDGNKNNWYCAMCFEIEVKVTKVFENIKVNGIERKVFHGGFLNDDIDELPSVLYPIQKGKNKPFDMVFNDGDRNNHLSSYAFYLGSKKGISPDNIVKIIHAVNDYILATPLEKREIDTILRKETLEKISKIGSKKDVLTYSVFHEYLKKIGFTVRYNELTNEFEYDVPSSFNDIDGYTSACQTHLRDDIRTDLNLKGVSTNEIIEQLKHESYLNSYNPLIEYLDECDWNENDDSMLEKIYDILGIKPDDDLSRMKLKKWLIQCVALVYNDKNSPIGAEGVLILSGAEGLGKTSFFREITPNNKWFISQTRPLNLQDKDVIIGNLRYWLVELGEIDTTFSHKSGSIKGFVTDTHDSIRKPYDREETFIVRRTSFCGTTNKREFLDKETGLRRWWVIEVEKIDLKALFNLDDEDLKALWGEIKYYYQKDKNSFRLNEKELNAIRIDNFKYMAFTELENCIIQSLDFNSNEWTWKSIDELKDMLTTPDYKLSTNNQVGNALKNISLLDARIKKKRTKKGWKYLLPPKNM